VAIAVEGFGVYSFGTRTPLGSSISDYLNDQVSARDNLLYRIETNALQDAAVLEYLRGKFGNLGLTEDNCAARTSNALARAGIKGSSRPLPFAIGTELDSNPLATATFIPQGGVLPVWVDVFNP